jgi:vacuolar-type H+-ATPase subunit I/STV1
MKRVQIIGPKEEFSRVVDFLYHEGTVHLENAVQCIPSSEIPLQKMEIEKTAEVAEILGKISGIFATLPHLVSDKEKQLQFFTELKEEGQDRIIERAKQVIQELESTTKELATRKSELTFTITALNKYEKVINTLQPIEHELPILEGFEVLALDAGEETKKRLFSGIEDLKILGRVEADLRIGRHFVRTCTSYADNELPALNRDCAVLQQMLERKRALESDGFSFDLAA